MAKVVITIEGGLIQSIISDQGDVLVMVLDYDTQGGDPERIKKFEEDEVYILDYAARIA